MSTTVTAQHPYTPAVIAGDLAFVSGALSVDENYAPVPGRETALDAAMDRTRDRLATVGGSLADIVKLTYYVTDLSLREEANRQFLTLFAEPRPARTFVEVSKLPYGATVEIDAIAQVHNGSATTAG